MPINFQNLPSQLIVKLKALIQMNNFDPMEEYTVCEFGEFKDARSVLWLMDCLDKLTVINKEENILYNVSPCRIEPVE